jgi:hypothetical protein
VERDSCAFLINVALSYKSYIPNVLIYETTVDPGQSSLHQPLNSDWHTAQSVTVWSLDDFLLKLIHKSDLLIDHMKIDTQGHDLFVMKGAAQVLEKTFYVTAEIDVGNDYDIDALNESNTLEFLDSMAFKQIRYFSARKLAGRFLRLKHINMIFELIKHFVPSHEVGKLLEVSDKPFFLGRKYYQSNNWIRFTDRTFVNTLLIKAHPKRVFRIFQRG